ncbi:MAG: pilus assembly protein [Silvanigrellales bacterium]|nr:pilus assembly protein [Silvanigrellales bacterium]
MVETVLCLPALLALTALVIEVARLSALSIVLQTATQDAARSLSLRWVHVEQRGWERKSDSNEPDLNSVFARAIESDVLAHVGAFPGYAPAFGTSKPSLPEGRLFFDKKGDTLTLRTHVCVPLLFLPWSSSGGKEGSASPPSSMQAKQASPGTKSRDCGGRFRASPSGFAWRLEASSTIELPASVSVFRQGLALPEHVPLVNVPEPAQGMFAGHGAGLAPSWNLLFSETPKLFDSPQRRGLP